MTRAMTTVVSNVHTSVITTSKPMKMKLRPTTLALREPGIGEGIVNVVKPIFECEKFARMQKDIHNKMVSAQHHDSPNRSEFHRPRLILTKRSVGSWKERYKNVPLDQDGHRNERQVHCVHP